MDKFQEKYIKLLKDYYKNNGNALSIEALCQFKEELEACEDTQAKSVLVYLYQLLSMQKSAYELLLKIHDKNDKKQLKRLVILRSLRMMVTNGQCQGQKTKGKF